MQDKDKFLEWQKKHTIPIFFKKIEKTVKKRVIQLKKQKS